MRISIALVLAGLSIAGTLQAQGTCTAPPLNMVSWWPGDGNYNDIIGGNNGTPVGGVTFGSGEVGQAFSFNGVSSYVDIGSPSSLNIQGPITVDAWVNPSLLVTSAGQAIFSQISGDYNLGEVELKIDPAGDFIWFRRPTQGSQSIEFVNTSILAVAGVWQHVTGVYDGANYQLYVNGVLEASTTQSGVSLGSGPDMTIGTDNQFVEWFVGLIDEVEVFNRALSSSEIQAIFNAGSAGKCKGLTFSPVSLTFSGLDVGTTSPPEVLTVTNVFSIPVAIFSIISNGDFAVQSSTCPISPSTLASGSSCTVDVTFTPSAPKQRTGTLTFTSSAPASPQAIVLTGTGIGPGAQLFPASLTFGSQLIGTFSPAKTVTLKNTGNAPLEIPGNGILTTGPFSQTNTCGTTLNAGASCGIFVSFGPAVKGPATGTLSITDNAPGSPQIVPLKGAGTVVKLSPTSLKFGNQMVGTTSSPQTVTLTNTSTTALASVSIGITGSNSGDFAQTNTCGTRIRPGSSCTITVTFTPTTQGARTAAVSVSDNGGGSPQTVLLAGTGT